MKMNRTMAFASLLFAMACSSSDMPGFDKTENGLYYNIVKGENQGDLVQMDDVITIDLVYQTDDTVLYDSKTVPFETQLKVGPSAYNGDVMEGFLLMSVGDEATFKTSADSFFSVIAKVDLPEFVQSGSYLTFNVKVNKAQTIEELQAERASLAEANIEIENAVIQQYIMENDVKAEPTESGLYYIETAPGDGVPLARGSNVKVHYLGRLLSGEKFDSSFDRDEPFEFTLGAGQVIPGWDEGIGYMTVGAKAVLVIPSNLAYGDSPPPGGIIKPFTPLVFDVELISVN
jgi:FKBP-type peptidyl-prolyl cis-trans isomerase